ncbi:MAG: nuclear transport factor 2 family protein [Desulfobacterales bacterium]
MVRSKPLILIIACLAAGLVGFFIFYQTDAEKIHSRLDELADRVSKTEPENELMAAGHAKNIAELFTDPCVLEIPHTPYREISGEFSRQDIRAYAMSGRGRYKQIQLNIYDISIDFPDETTANVRLTARVKTGENDGTQFDEFNELACEFVKIEGDWYIHRVAAVEVLER